MTTRERVAAIDIGTNSTRLLVAEAAGTGSLHTVERINQITRLGHGDITVKFGDSESTLTTRANLVIVESAMHSSLTAGLAVKIGRKLIGGTAQAADAGQSEAKAKA